LPQQSPRGQAHEGMAGAISPAARENPLKTFIIQGFAIVFSILPA
jgi:hypothetical protein